MLTVMPEPDGGWRNRWARRRAERAFARDLDTKSRERAADQTAADREAGRATDPLPWLMRLLATAVAAVVLSVAAVIALVAIGAQIGFYDKNLGVKDIDFAAIGINHKLNLPTFTPIATEGMVWATTLLAVVMVLLGRTAGLWTRSMWTFASISAFISAWYSINDEHDLFGGLLRGSLSIAGPFLIHLFILWCRHLRTGRTFAQARVEMDLRWRAIGAIVVAVLIVAGRHVRHPTIAIRATGYRLGVDGWTYQDAWRAASVRYRRTVQAQIEGTYTNPVVEWVRQRLDRAKKPVQRRGKPARQELSKSTPVVAERKQIEQPTAQLVDITDVIPKREQGRRYVLAQRAAGRPVEDISAAEVDRVIGANSYSKKFIADWRAEALADMSPGTAAAGN